MGNRTATLGSETGQVDLLWNPYQQAFLQALDQRLKDGRRAWNRLSIFAGRRGGKTKIGGVAAVKEMKPKTLGWCCAPSYPELHDYVLPAVLNIIPRSWVASWSESRLEMTLHNGATVAFRSLDDPNRARGPGLDWAWIDEVRKVQPLAWETMLPALIDKRGVAFFTTSPNSFDWCYKKLWRPAIDGEPGYWACRYRTSDNPSIDKTEIEAAQRVMDPLFFAQEFNADFVTFTGAIYGSALNPQVLYGQDQLRAVLPEWPRVNNSRAVIVGMDPGADHPFAAVILAATERGMVVVGEYLARNKSAFEHKRALTALLASFNPSNPITPDQWAIDKTQRQMMIELAQPPFPLYTTGTESNVVAGINRVQTWLMSRQLWLPELVCPQLIEQLRGYRWDENYDPKGEAKIERVLKIDDDLPDALRYAMMLWPELPVTEVQAGITRDFSNFTEDQRWGAERALRIANREMAEARGDTDSLTAAMSDDDEAGLAGAWFGTEDDRGTLGDFYG